jgi:hypothetical protein
MKQIATALLLVFLLFLAGCHHREKTLEGILQTGPEQSAFFLDGHCSNKPFWFTWPDRVDSDSEAKLKSVEKAEALRLTVVAKLSPVGEYGHLGGYPREVQAIKIVSVSAATPCPWPGDEQNSGQQKIK